MIQLAANAMMGATLAVAITLIGRSSFAYLAGLLPLFPCFALYAHFAAFNAGGVESLKPVVAFGLISLIAYAAYLCCLLLLADHLKFSGTILSAIALWTVTAGSLIGLWNRFDLEAQLFIE